MNALRWGIAVLLIAPVASAAADPSPLELVRTRINEARSAYALESSEARLEGLRAVFDRSVDLPAFAARALGKAWNEMSAPQRNRFLGALRQQLETSYLKRESREWPGDRLQLTGEKVEESRARVTGRIPQDEIDIEVEVVLIRSDGTWKAVDLILDMLSLTESYGDQFRTFLQEHSIDELIAQLEKKASPVPTRAVTAPTTP